MNTVAEIEKRRAHAEMVIARMIGAFQGRCEVLINYLGESTDHRCKDEMKRLKAFLAEQEQKWETRYEVPVDENRLVEKEV